jgi:hypothetical protein
MSFISPSEAWCVELDCTNKCFRRCSNCTRMVAHFSDEDRYEMTPEQFRNAVLAVRDFVTDSLPDRYGRRKIIGIMGGESLMCDNFPAYVDIMCELVPRKNRGLLTGLPWRSHRYAREVIKLLGPRPSPSIHPNTDMGWINENFHTEEMAVHHQPVLVAAEEVIADKKEMWRLVDNCWLHELWSPCVNPSGFWFCEIAGAMATAMQDTAEAIPLSEDCWRGDIGWEEDESGVPFPTGKFAKQIAKWCPRCGIPLPTKSRRDKEGKDDMTAGNVERLMAAGSPRVAAGDVVPWDGSMWDEKNENCPREYIRGERR